jgi:hypothetical protein
MATDAYFIVGHGVDNLKEFHERKRMPEGTYLVTLAECGVETKGNQVHRVIRAFSDLRNEEIIKDPIIKKKALETLIQNKVHVFPPGSLYPELQVQLLADWDKKTYDVVKSGVYKFPINMNAFLIGDGEEEVDRLFRKYKSLGYGSILNDEIDVEQIYKDSLFPTVTEAKSEFEKTKKISKIRKELTVSLDNIMTKLGPGIYYYIICRSAPELPTIESFSLMENHPLSAYATKNVYEHAGNIANLLEAEAKAAKHKWMINEFTEGAEKYRAVRHVPLLRADSLAQQAALAPARKTRRTRRKRRNSKTRKMRSKK